MASLLSPRSRHRGRATALVVTLSLVVTPLLVAPSAYGATDAVPSSTAPVETVDEPAVVADVVAPEADQLDITGTLQVGETVVVDPLRELWAPAPSDVELTFKYQWLADGVALDGAEGAELVLPPGSVDTLVSVEIVGTAAGGVASASVIVAASQSVAEGRLAAGKPAISGAVRVGSKVTAKPGTWTSGTALSYQWYASGKAISGATKSTYTPTASVKGKTLTVKVTGQKTGYTTVTKTSSGKTVAAGVLSAPKPTISGTVRVGSKVTAKPGTWTSGTALSYQWYASGKKMSGATKSTYTLPASVKGKTLTVKVTGKKTGYTTVTKASSGKKVAAGVLSAPKPKIKGTVKVGSTVSVSRGTWKPGATTYRYQWKVGGKSIKGATGSKYKIPARYAGMKLTVSVKGSRAGYTTRTVTSSGSKMLRVYSKTAAPKVTGTVRVGSTLKVGSKGTWSPAPSSWKYQWKANGTAIKGATKSSFKLTSAQHGKKITVTVTGARSGYYASSRTSSATAKVAWPKGVSKPKVTKQPQAAWVSTGKSVKFSASASGGKLKYQWQKRTVDSNKWVNVSGKTSASYTLTAKSKDTLAEYRVRVTNVAGTTYSKAAMLYVDSSKKDPYADGQWYVGNFWLQSVWQTESYTEAGTGYVDAWFMGCSLGGPASSIWGDLDISYVDKNGRPYSNVQGYPYDTDDGCEQIVIQVEGISASAAKGGVWKIVDRSGSSQYGSSTQWVRGLR